MMLIRNCGGSHYGENPHFVWSKHSVFNKNIFWWRALNLTAWWSWHTMVGISIFPKKYEAFLLKSVKIRLKYIKRSSTYHFLQFSTYKWYPTLIRSSFTYSIWQKNIFFRPNFEIPAIVTGGWLLWRHVPKISLEHCFKSTANSIHSS